MPDQLLTVNGLSMEFYNEGNPVRAVQNVSFHIGRGEILGVVGESGCGKSVTSLCILRLIPAKQGRVTSGQAIFEGKDLLTLPRREFSRITGKDISIIFQEPLSSLNPLLTCGLQIAENLRFHERMGKKEAMEKAAALLDMAGIPLPQKRVNEYPHQLSGGMRQRVMIAMAIACTPKLLIADEPTTALDVTIQAQILEIIKRLRRELGMSVMFITHDMGVIADMADRVMVMYAGGIMEEADVKTFFHQPLHPYTRGLLRSIPRPGDKNEKLFMIKGTVPVLTKEIPGCKYCERCDCPLERCSREQPPFLEVGNGHKVACWLYADSVKEG